MEKLKITQIYTTDKNKDGSPLMSKAGKPYTRMSIKTNEYGDQWLSGFKGKQNDGWKVGDEVEVLVEKKQSGDKTFLNFSLPKPEEKTGQELIKIHMLLTGINIDIQRLLEAAGLTSKPIPKKVDTIEYPDEDINVEDIPF